jgi:hypothetical protein
MRVRHDAARILVGPSSARGDGTLADQFEKEYPFVG